MDDIVSINDEHNQYVELVKARIGENHEAYRKENEALNRAPKRNKKRNLLEECWVYVREFCMEDESAENVCSVIITWYLDQQLRLPTCFDMETMVLTYRARLNELQNDDHKLSDREMATALYGKVLYESINLTSELFAVPVSTANST